MTAKSAVLRGPGPVGGAGAFTSPIQSALVGHRTRAALTVLAVVGAGFAGVALDGTLANPPALPYWTRAALAPAILLWMLCRLPRMTTAAQKAFDALKALRAPEAAPLDDPPPYIWQNSALTAVLGFAWGFVVVSPWRNSDPGIYNGRASGWVAAILMGACFTVLIGMIATNHRVSQVLRRELNGALVVDPLNSRAFQPITNWALSVMVTFLGQVTLIVALYSRPLLTFPSSLIIPGLVIGPMGIFARTLWKTHTLMAQARRAEVEVAHRHWRDAYDKMKANPECAGEMAHTVNAWLTCEQRMRALPEWPYTIQTLRTLAVSVALPVATALFEVYKP